MDFGNFVLFIKLMCLVLMLKKLWKIVVVGSRDLKIGLYKFFFFVNSLEVYNIEVFFFIGEILSEIYLVIMNVMLF